MQLHFRQNTVVPDLFLKRQGGFSDVCVFGVSPLDGGGLLILNLTGEWGQFGFCYILEDYCSKMKCWLTVFVSR